MGMLLGGAYLDQPKNKRCIHVGAKMISIICMLLSMPCSSVLSSCRKQTTQATEFKQ